MNSCPPGHARLAVIAAKHWRPTVEPVSASRRPGPSPLVTIGMLLIGGALLVLVLLAL